MGYIHTTKEKYCTLKLTPSDLRLLAEFLERNHTDSIDIRLIDSVAASSFIDLKTQT